jgi:hypothetical protein
MDTLYNLDPDDLAPVVSPETILRFDYSTLEPDTADTLRRAAERVRNHASAVVLDVGRALLEVKDLLDHGQWAPWLESECQLKERTAQRMMNAARWAAEKSVTVTDLPPGILYRLSARSTPTETADEILARYSNGERLSSQTVAAILRAERPARSEGRCPEQAEAPDAGEPALAPENSRPFKPKAPGPARRDPEAAEQQLIALLLELPNVVQLIELLEACGNPLADPIFDAWANSAGTATPDQPPAIETAPPTDVAAPAQRLSGDMGGRLTAPGNEPVQAMPHRATGGGFSS